MAPIMVKLTSAPASLSCRQWMFWTCEWAGIVCGRITAFKSSPQHIPFAAVPMCHWYSLLLLSSLPALTGAVPCCVTQQSTATGALLLVHCC
ncbi:hypothetical protein FB45DRAFT_1005529, partial [Roridomyces roridus]